MKKEVLLIEDDRFQEKIFRKILTETLQQYGCETRCAHRGKEALEHIRKHKNNIVLIILDIALPDMSGLQLLPEIQKIDAALPVIALSANEDKDVIVEAIRLGARDYFVKGKDKDELMKFLECVTDLIVEP